LPADYLAFLLYLPFVIVTIVVADAPRLAALNALIIASLQLTLTPSLGARRRARLEQPGVVAFRRGVLLRLISPAAASPGKVVLTRFGHLGGRRLCAFDARGANDLENRACECGARLGERYAIPVAKPCRL